MKAVWTACLECALRQFGLISLEQARCRGCSKHALHRQLTAGRLDRILPSVYRLTDYPEGWHQSVMALTLWGAVASHTTAAALLKLRGFEPGDIHGVTTKDPRRLPGWALAHQVAQLPPGCWSVAGIPTTPPWVTLVHLGAAASPESVARALDDGLHRGLVSLPQMRWALSTFGDGGAGTKVMQGLLEERGPGYSPPEGELEERFFALVAPLDLPPVVRQFRIWDGSKWRRFDLAFPEYKLAIELDGWEKHGTREAFQDDRARDRATQILGWRVLRFTWDDVVHHPSQVIAEMERALGQKLR